ncbi:flagellar biosynthetic protein FliR [Clostridia bacterium]|nr:flagellar biosynthetic protein FliR [Clostridia bacterium]
MPIEGSLEAWVIHFFMMVTRMSALFILSPIFGRNQIPMYVKIMLSMMMGFIAVQWYPPPAAMPPTLMHFALQLSGELAVGLMIGWVTTLFFSVVYTAGQFIDMQIGFGMVQIYDVATNAQVPVAGTLLNLVLVECFIVTDGLPKVVRLLFYSLEIIPVGEVSVTPAIGALMLSGFVEAFIIALSVAAPILTSAMVAEIALGILVRTAPQMNIFAVGMPLKTLLGLLMLVVIMPIFVMFTNTIFENMWIFMSEVLKSIAPS